MGWVGKKKSTAGQLAGTANELTKEVLERAVHRESPDPAGRGSGNSRSGSTPKTVTTVNPPTEAISGRVEHLRGSTLGFRNLTN